MSDDSSNNLDLHFELKYIAKRNVKDVVHHWQQIYDTTPDKAIWVLIQLFIDSTGYLLDTKINHSSKNFMVKNIKTIVTKIPTKNFTNEKFILILSTLRENVSLFLREIILANLESQYFFGPYITNAIVFLFQLTKKPGEIFYTTGSVLLMDIMCTLLDVAQEFSGNGIMDVINKYAHCVFGHIVRSLEFHDCVHIMCTLFLGAFEKVQQSFLKRINVKNIFLTMLSITDSITSKILQVVKNVLEKEQTMSDKLYMFELFGSKEIMQVFLHDAMGTNKRIAQTSHEIINIIINFSGKIRIKQYDYTPLLFRIYDTNKVLKKLGGTTFRILHSNQSIIRKMITFYLQYPKYQENISDLVDACFSTPNQINSHVNELIRILREPETLIAYKITCGQILLHLYRNILCEYQDHSSNLLERIPELLSLSTHIPHLTLNILEIVIHDATDTNDSIIIPIIESLAELVITHTDYDILCAANLALYKLSTQCDKLFTNQWSHAGLVQSIYNDYDLSRIMLREESDMYKTCLIRFRAATEFTKCVYDYFDTTFQNILDTLFRDLTTQCDDDGIREHQIILYTTLMNASFTKNKCVEIVERTRPFLELLVTILADSTEDSKLNTLLTHAVIPGICNFYIMASHPIDLPNNTNRIQEIPPYVYSNIGSALAKLSGTLSEAGNNMSVMKILLEYWNTLHKLQKIPRRPEANKILFLYGNIEELTDLLENLLLNLYNATPDHILMITSIGQTFSKLLMLDKSLARNYTNSLYKYLTRKSTKIEEEKLLKLINAILKYVFNIMEIQLKVSDLENKNRLLLFNFLHNYIKRIKGQWNDNIIQVINRILEFDTISQEESNTLKNIKAQLGRSV